MTAFLRAIGSTWRAICGLVRRSREQVTDNAVDDLKCDILLFFATQTEREQLERGTTEIGLPFEERNDARVGTYFTLGTIGPNRVRAVKTRMGPFFHQGLPHRPSSYAPQARRHLSSRWVWRSGSIARHRSTETCWFRNGYFPMTIA